MTPRVTWWKSLTDFYLEREGSCYDFAAGSAVRLRPRAFPSRVWAQSSNLPVLPGRAKVPEAPAPRGDVRNRSLRGGLWVPGGDDVGGGPPGPASATEPCGSAQAATAQRHGPGGADTAEARSPPF